MCIRVHSKGQFWQIVDGPGRLVLWKSEKKNQLCTVCSDLLFYFKPSFPHCACEGAGSVISDAVRVPCGAGIQRDVPSECWELNHGIV